MCGITGFIAESINQLEEDIFRMQNKLLHRGPDAQGVWIDQENLLALAHTRLSIQDTTSAGSQPMRSKSGRYVIVYNGEIYNHMKLRHQLSFYSWNGHSDTETLLALIEEFGIKQTLEQITGMFAFALWDSIDKKLILARDRFGEKPLYYADFNGHFAFASEIKSLYEYAFWEGSINKEALNLYFKYGYIPSPYSIWNRVYKVCPGNYISKSIGTDNSCISTTQYWSAAAVAECASLDKRIEDPEDLIHNTLQSIVKDQLVSDVPLGAFLSGGVDSSLIVSLMQKMSRRPIKTFTVGFSESQYDESVYAQKVADHLGTDHQTYMLSPEDALSLVNELSSVYDEPLGDVSQIPTLMVSKIASNDVTVCLTGDGGDEIFGGYSRYLYALRYWKKLSVIPLVVRRFCRYLTTSILEKFNWLFEFQNFISLRDCYIMTGLSIDDFYDNLFSFGPSPLKNKLASSSQEKNPWFWQQLGALKCRSPLLRFMLRDQISYMTENNLYKVDRASMNSSLETRQPFLDHNLLNYCYRLPERYRIDNNVTKILLKKILHRYLPSELINRPKKGFALPVDIWLRKSCWGSMANELLEPRYLCRQGIFNVNLVQKIWKQHLAQTHNHKHWLWYILSFQIWYQYSKQYITTEDV